MSVRRPISFWRYSLNAELLAAGLAGLVLLVGSWITLRQLEQRYLALFRTDAERVNLYLHEHLATGIAQLERLAARAPEQDLLPDPLVLQPFSDLYLMDASQRIRQVLKATPGSRVFSRLFLRRQPDPVLSASGRCFQPSGSGFHSARSHSGHLRHHPWPGG